MKKKVTKSDPEEYRGFLTFMDYAATGEGRTVELNFCYADTETEARRKHLEKFYPNDKSAQDYFSAGVNVMLIKSKRAKKLMGNMFRFGKGLHKTLCEAGIEFHLKLCANYS